MGIIPGSPGTDAFGKLREFYQRCCETFEVRDAAMFATSLLFAAAIALVMVSGSLSSTSFLMAGFKPVIYLNHAVLSFIA